MLRGPTGSLPMGYWQTRGAHSGFNMCRYSIQSFIFIQITNICPAYPSVPSLSIAIAGLNWQIARRGPTFTHHKRKGSGGFRRTLVNSVLMSLLTQFIGQGHACPLPQEKNRWGGLKTLVWLGQSNIKDYVHWLAYSKMMIPDMWPRWFMR